MFEEQEKQAIHREEWLKSLERIVGARYIVVLVLLRGLDLILIQREALESFQAGRAL